MKLYCTLLTLMVTCLYVMCIIYRRMRNRKKRATHLSRPGGPLLRVYWYITSYFILCVSLRVMWRCDGPVIRPYAAHDGVNYARRVISINLYTGWRFYLFDSLSIKNRSLSDFQTFRTRVLNTQYNIIVRVYRSDV